MHSPFGASAPVLVSGRRPGLSRRSWLLAAAASAACAPAAAQRVLTVGAGATHATLAGAIAASADGDRIDVLPGTYRGDVAVVERRRLWIRGLGTGAVLDADGRHAGGKGILVVRGEVTVENIEFRGARVPDGNGAGIRFDHGRLTVRRCRFFDNENGLLASNDPAAELEIEDSVFADAPRHAGLLHHLLYAGTIRRLALTGSRFENGWRGHLVKSRARENRIECNLLRDGPHGEASYELELPNGGHNLVTGNVIVQGPRSQNRTIVAVGYDADARTDHSLVFVHNTLVNNGAADCRFLHLESTRMPRLAPLQFANNLLVGPGPATWPAGADAGGNVSVPTDAIGQGATGAYRLRSACEARYRATDLPEAWRPRRALTPWLGTRPWPGGPACVGALQA